MAVTVTPPGPTQDRRPSAGAHLGLRQDRARGPGPWPARGRGRDRVDRRLGRAHRGPRHPGDRGRRPHRLPGVPRGPGQDPAPPRARRHPRRHPQARPRRAAGRARGRAVRARRRQPLPVRGRRSPRARRPTRSSSRSTSAARRWCGPRPRTTRASPWSSTRRHTTPSWTRCARAASRSSSARRSRRRRSSTRRPTTSTSRRGWATPTPTAARARASPPGRARRGTKAAVLRYGENPHQRAALYTNGFQPEPGLAQARQLHGKEMSYNNFVDADAAVRAAHDHGDQPTVAVVKHANPCGIAVGADIAEAHRKAHECDPVSAFGGIIATNRTGHRRDGPHRRRHLHRGRRRARLRRRRARGAHGEEEHPAARVRPARAQGGAEIRPISGGLLMQHRDAVDAVVTDDEGAVTGGDDAASWRLVSGEAADEALLADLQFAWRSVRAVKSNAILLARGGASVGIGMGQVNRVDSCHLAVSRANAGDASGPGARWRPRTRSSRSPTGCRCCSTRVCGPSSRPAGRCVTPRSSRRPRRPA